MGIKKIYKGGIDFSKYLFGYDIHNSNTKRRKEVRESEDNLGKRVLKLSSNYAWEGFRQVVRYTPLILEGLILYNYITDELSLYNSIPIWLCTSAPIRLVELMTDLKYSVLKLERDFKKFAENYKEFAEEFRRLYDDPEFRALCRGKLLADPYLVLDVSKTASEREIKKAYRKIAFECHPDRNNKNKEKTEKFIEATKAYYQLTGKYSKL